ncbi:DUF4167 domain-containing protein [Jiella mangrovi]|uniref:DUF4167 domain-containing protein n=1 Tax=Jiella mangrovi TaxID=2821407 RepID=A0ABS4BN76_9HYPH|nr:DUF4167 domain-containing protein [Jiella mangrovi]MBP0618188.1 DUF4167 domain-containing protein [Jiella mangrovi]
MRPGQQQKNRMRGRGRKGPNPLSRNYESNGPDVKIRGSAQHVADKYAMLARDASAAGDRVMAENYLQHAEHYNRIIAAAQAQFQQPRDDRETRDSDDDEDDDDNFDNNSYSRNDRDDRNNDRSDRNDRNERGDRRQQHGNGRDGRDHGGGNRNNQRNRDDNQRGRDDNGQRDRRERNAPAGSGPQPVIMRGEGENRGNGHDAGANGAADEAAARSNERSPRDHAAQGRGANGRDDASQDGANAETTQNPIGMTAAEALEETQSRAKRRPRSRRPRLADKYEANSETSDEAPATAETAPSEPVAEAAKAAEDTPKKASTRRKPKAETADGEEKPKRRRTTRAKKSDDGGDGDGDGESNNQGLPDFLLASNG